VQRPEGKTQSRRVYSFFWGLPPFRNNHQIVTTEAKALNSCSFYLYSMIAESKIQSLDIKKDFASSNSIFSHHHL